jgi:hypothetical protein
VCETNARGALYLLDSSTGARNKSTELRNTRATIP